MKIRLFGIFRKKKKCVFKITRHYGKFITRGHLYLFVSGNERRIIAEKSNYKWKDLRTN